jgi:hypothetical protein
VRNGFDREDWFWIGFALLGALFILVHGQAFAADTNTNCDGWTAHASYGLPEPGDIVDATHFEVTRPFEGSHLKLNVGAGDLRIAGHVEIKSLVD